MPTNTDDTLRKLDALNTWLGDVYGEETLFRTLLTSAEFSETEIEQIKRDHLSEFLQAVINLLDSYTDLPRAERNILMIQHYGLINGKPQSFKAIGDSVGVGGERIRQLVNKRLAMYHDPDRQAEFHEHFAEIGRRLLNR